MSQTSSEHVDVLIVGAGLSGIGAACHLRERCPGKTFALLEARSNTGGTWDLFRYPGIRSDSDMYTLGYSFRPWQEAKAIADGPDILSYVRETAAEYGIEDRIRLNHRVVAAEWSTDEARWAVRAQRTDSGDEVTMTCNFLFTCSGYYNYEQGYRPEFPGEDRYRGEIIHPQHWPEDTEYAGKRVVVIGSGATAVTLVPAMAADAAHVTMLQRSPTWIVSMPGQDPIARLVRRVLPAKLTYSILRWKNVMLTLGSFQLSRWRPGAMKRILKAALGRHLTAEQIRDHFTPDYNPWDQRICLVPDADLFDSLKDGSASVVTDRIETFTESGIKLESGAQLEADLVVSATGLNLLAIGGIALTVDGREIALPETMVYKGMMFGDVPNFAVTLGYTNASWTLKADLTSEYVCRLLNHMDEHGYAYCVPGERDPSVEERPFLDFASGYVQRSIADFPKQGSQAPWRLHQNYPLDIRLLRRGELVDGVMVFAGPESAPAEAELLAA